MKKSVLVIVSLVFTVMILTFLFVLGPAQAFILGLKISDKDVNKGEKISFIASTEIEDEEFLEIDHFILQLDGPEKRQCHFSTNGTIISGCQGIIIQQISFIDVGYGYSFGKGNLSYNITLDTSEYSVGVYKPTLFIVLNKQMIGKESENIIIRGGISRNRSCSVRGNAGNLFVENLNLDGNNKLSFYIPHINLKNGEGSLTGQANRKRFTYDFKIADVLENTKKINLVGDAVNLNNMNATFVFECNV